MKLLLAIDSSDLSEVVINAAATRPWPAGTEVCVLTVIDLFALTYSIGYLEPFMKKEGEAAEALVRRVAEQLRQRHIDAHSRAVEGYPSTAIVDHAGEWGADLIMLGSHGHSGLVRFFVGSVAKAVVHNAPCSVEIVRASGPSEAVAGPMKILLATDGSDCSTAAVRSVAERPWPPDSEARIVSIADVFVPAIDPWYTAGEALEQVRQASRTQAEEALAEAQKLVAGAGLKTSTEVLMGSPKARIVDEANEWGASLVVLGSHGRRGLARVLLGSVSEAVAIRAHCSVEVIRMRSRADQK